MENGARNACPVRRHEGLGGGGIGTEWESLCFEIVCKEPDLHEGTALSGFVLTVPAFVSLLF